MQEVLHILLALYWLGVAVSFVYFSVNLNKEIKGSRSLLASTALALIWPGLIKTFIKAYKQWKSQ